MMGWGVLGALWDGKSEENDACEDAGARRRTLNGRVLRVVAVMGFAFVLPHVWKLEMPRDWDNVSMYFSSIELSWSEDMESLNSLLCFR